MVPQVVQVTLLRRTAAALQPLRWGSVRESFAAQLAAIRNGRGTPLRLAPGAGAWQAQGTARARTRPAPRDAAGAPATIGAWLETPRQRALAAAITRASQQVGVAPELSLAVAVAESSLDPTARSADGLSSGTFQVTGATAADVRRRIAARELARPPGGDDVALGVAHLRYLDHIFARDAHLGGDLRTVPIENPHERSRFAVAAYNAGQGRVARAQEQAAALRRDPTRYESIRSFLPRITQQYVDRVMRYSGRATPDVRTA